MVLWGSGLTYVVSVSFAVFPLNPGQRRRPLLFSGLLSPASTVGTLPLGFLFEGFLSSCFLCGLCPLDTIMSCNNLVETLPAPGLWVLCLYQRTNVTSNETPPSGEPVSSGGPPALLLSAGM